VVPVIATPSKSSSGAADESSRLVGRVFGRLQVVARAGSTDRTLARPLWSCRCACGNEPIGLVAYLLAGRTRSCGCLRAERARASIAVARAMRRRRRLCTVDM
jgi:hypothetical protein